jgi:predicted ATPase/DNA-binding NarL/FixJ family response regulator
MRSATYCAACDTWIAARTGSRQRYCSNACRQRAYRKRTATHGNDADERSSQSRTAKTVPARLDNLIGRKRELERLKALANRPLVTITGPPGVGKSRLTARLAEISQAAFADGIRWLDLERMERGEDLEHAAGALLGADGPGIDRLVSAVGNRQLMLVLDNSEHLLDECAALVETLVACCPRLRVVVTSRETLRIPGEIVFGVEPLSLPLPGETELRPLLCSGAVRLFAERASAGNPDFVLSETNAPVIAELCRQLDGLPLSIELAAHRVGMLSVTELRARLRQPMKVLTVGSRTASRRHRSLRAALDSSYVRLLPAEQAVCRRLSVLSGWLDLDLATAVCRGDDLSEEDIFELLARLQATSLLVASVGSPDRAHFRQLNSLRCYAAEQLEKAGELDATWERLLVWLTGRVRELGGRIATPARELARLDNLQDYLLAAAGWAIGRDDERAAPLTVVLARMAQLQNCPDTRTDRLVRGALRAATTDTDHALLLTELAATMRLSGNVAEALDAARAAVARTTTDKSPVARARALLELAACQQEVGSAAGAVTSAAEAHRLAESIGTPEDTVLCLAQLAAHVSAAGQPDTATALIDKAVHDADHAEDAAMALCTAADIALARGDLDTAAARATEAVRRTPGAALHRPMTRLAAIAARHGDGPRALRLAELARLLRPRPGPGDNELDALVDDAIDRSGTADAEAIRATASTLSLDAARAFALGGPWPANAATGPRVDTLTPGQRAIAAFVAEGLTNSQIASRLGISPRTVAVRLARLRSALELRSRAQVAAWARSPWPHADLAETYPSLARNS